MASPRFGIIVEDESSELSFTCMTHNKVIVHMYIVQLKLYTSVVRMHRCTCTCTCTCKDGPGICAHNVCAYKVTLSYCKNFYPPYHKVWYNKEICTY